MSKDSLVKGTIILALAALIARVLGAVQRIPLIYLLDNNGMATYSNAFNIYMMLLVVATAGIPSALSKLVSERTALGQYDEANRIYKAAVLFALTAGAVMTVLLIVLAPAYETISKVPATALSIRALAPALLLFPVIAIMRGYFQGRQRMAPNGLSQIVEQLLRIVVAVGLAYLLLQIGWGHDWAVAGASFGGVAGSVGAVLVMLYYGMKLKREDRRSGETGNRTPVARMSYGDIFRKLFKVSVPIVLFSLAVPLINAIDTTITVGLLETDIGHAAAVDALGILGGRAQSLAGIPIILAIALSQSTVPVISSAFAKKDMATVNAQASKALYISVITGLPLVLAICAAARPINIFMFGDDSGTGIIAMLTAIAVFQIVMQTSGAVLMGIGQMRPLIVHVGIGIVVKLVVSFLLAPVIGIYGIIAATALCFIVMAQLNLVVLRKHVDYTILGKKWTGLAFTTLLAYAAGFGLELLAHRYVQPFGYRMSHMVDAILVGGVAFGLYIGLLALTKVVTAEDVARLPGPLRKVMSRFVRRPAASSGNRG
ncbi:putative polysaccharide biosynthesis protein [Paenibacillus ginsengarvi]|uniref:putative polysaccharide biosynthesis protein n=1 Tax=Paenibacillus ginsengarvi TaxID=400777 RepID=UPI001874ABAF|nr:polysaccharide biosynthesis protein [Paenibacillus ginsengarvi]